MRKIEVVLGGVTYVVQELPVRKNAGWRKQLDRPFAQLATALKAAPDRQIDNPTQLRALLNDLSGLLLNSVDTLTELLFAYSPELVNARAVIEESAYDSEILEAFTGVLGLAYPFGVWKDKLLPVLAQLGNGSRVPPISMN